MKPKLCAVYLEYLSVYTEILRSTKMEQEKFYSWSQPLLKISTVHLYVSAENKLHNGNQGHGFAAEHDIQFQSGSPFAGGYIPP